MRGAVEFGVPFIFALGSGEGVTGSDAKGVLDFNGVTCSGPSNRFRGSESGGVRGYINAVGIGKLGKDSSCG